MDSGKTNILKNIRREETAFMFDVDGVLTNPKTANVNRRLIQFIAKNLDLGIPTCIFTGSSFKWTNDKIIKLIRSYLINRFNLRLLFVSCEFGGVNVKYDETGQEIVTINEKFMVDEKIRDAVKLIVANESDIFFDNTKKQLLPLIYVSLEQDLQNK